MGQTMTSNPQNPDLATVLWRYFTGAHFDGKPRTNATWRKHGTIPKGHITWWTGKPRFHRMGIRWAILIIPAAWILAYTEFQLATLIVSLAFMPYALHHGSLSIHRRTTMVHKVHVPERPSMANVREHKHVDNTDIAPLTEMEYPV